MKTSKKKTQSQLNQLLGITFKNPSLLEAALNHPSYRNENKIRKLLDFDRLEFFGDAILNMVVCQKLYRKYPKANEGLLSRLRSIVVSRRILSRVARETGLHRHVRLGKSLRKLPLISKVKILTDCFEAFLAAVYLDRGLKTAEKFTLRCLGKYFDSKRLFRLDPNPKSTLQEISQKQWQVIPVYVHRQTSKGIRASVSIKTRRKASAVARTRQEAEERAARLLIRKIRQGLLLRSKRVSSGKKLRKTL